MKTVFKKQGLVSAFDIEGNLVKLAQIDINENRRVLRVLASARAASPHTGELAKCIYGLNSRFKSTGSLVLVNLPRHMATVREIKLPSVSPEELEGMIGLQASKLLPYPKEEIVYSYKVIEASETGFSRVMLVLTHNKVVEKLLKPFRQSGIDVGRIALSSEALSLWYLSKQPSQQKKFPTALIDIDSVSAGIQIVTNGIIEFTRAFTFSPQDKEIRLIDEIRRSFLTYKKTSKLDVSRLVLTGAESVLANEAPLLKKEFNLPTTYVNSLSTYPAAKDAKFPPEETRKNTCFTAALALAFNFDKLDLNLLPSGVREARLARITRETLFITGLLCLTVVLAAGGLVWKKISDKINYLKYVNVEIEKTDPEVQELTMMDNSVSIIKEEIDMKGAGIDIIRELYKLIPSNISLTIFNFERGSSCTLRGAADELSSVFKFVTILENSPYFKNVEVRYATKRVVKKRTITDFEIISRLE